MANTCAYDEHAALVDQYRDETPEQRQARVRRPVSYNFRLVERDPHERPVPAMPEILQPDTLAMLQRLQRSYMDSLDFLAAA